MYVCNLELRRLMDETGRGVGLGNWWLKLRDKADMNVNGLENGLLNAAKLVLKYGLM